MGSSRIMDQTCVPLAGRFFTTEPPGKPLAYVSWLTWHSLSCSNFCSNRGINAELIYFFYYYKENYNVSSVTKGSSRKLGTAWRMWVECQWKHATQAQKPSGATFVHLGTENRSLCVESTNFYLYLFMASLCGLLDLSSPIRDRTQALNTKSLESQPLNGQGIPWNLPVFKYWLHLKKKMS